MNILELPELAKKFEVDNELLEKRKSEYKELVKRSSSLLPFEQEQYDNLITSKQGEINKIEDNVNPYDNHYKRIDMGYVYKLRIYDRKLGFNVPRFAVYNMGERVMEMRLTSSIDRGLLVDYPNHNYYSDIHMFTFKDYANAWAFNIETRKTITHKFSGFLPDETRNIINEVTQKKDFGFRLSDMYLIEESYNWELNKETRIAPRNLDPVIVGRKNGVFYYITHFDVTPAEKFLVSEMVG